MLEALLVLPALGLAFLVAGRGSTPHRIGRLVAMGATVAVVSLSYMTFVALTPASQRPYVDGSPDNSVYHQVFVYNGFNRVGQASPNQLLGQTLGTRLVLPGGAPAGVEPAPDRRLRTRHGLAAAGRTGGFRLARAGAPTAPARGPGAGRRVALGRVAGRPRGGLHRQHDHELLLRRRARRRPWPGCSASARPWPGSTATKGGAPRDGRRRARHGRLRGLAPAGPGHRPAAGAGRGRRRARPGCRRPLGDAGAEGPAAPTRPGTRPDRGRCSPWPRCCSCPPWPARRWWPRGWVRSTRRSNRRGPRR